jgi:hypothetical protein
MILSAHQRQQLRQRRRSSGTDPFQYIRKKVIGFDTINRGLLNFFFPYLGKPRIDKVHQQLNEIF